MAFSTNLENFTNDLKEIVSLFPCKDLDVSHLSRLNDSKFENVVMIDGRRFVYQNDHEESDDLIVNKRLQKRAAKLSLYLALSEYFNISLPWGSLTGIRPIKLARFLTEREGVSDLRDYFQNVLCVSKSKTDIALEILNKQLPLFNKDEKQIDVYVGIPFCVSRCSYCSFISADISKLSDALIEEYVNAVLTEVNHLKGLINKNGYSVRAVYVGGGTPTSLDAKRLSQILSALNFGQIEFTVEAGRPDTLSKEKFEAILSSGANRVSINPQTSSDATLVRIGRKHTYADFLRAFSEAKAYGFLVNCDLIAGLQGEDEMRFLKSVSDVLSLHPDNLTLHSLSMKAGSIWKEQGFSQNLTYGTDIMDRAYELVRKEGLDPYYLYRQKYTLGNLENTGFALPGTECLYNIDIMEEDTSIIALGGNAISKRVFRDQNRIERQCNPKDTVTYLKKLPILLQEREKLFSE